jgi:hypothetical protein
MVRGLKLSWKDNRGIRQGSETAWWLGLSQNYVERIVANRYGRGIALNTHQLR